MRQVIECGNCHRSTTVVVPKPVKGIGHNVQARGGNRSKAADVVESKQTTAGQTVAGERPMENPTSVAARTAYASQNSTTTASATAATAKANASSKKRAKQRKAGLQALLNQAQTSTSRNLSLADFMKR